MKSLLFIGLFIFGFQTLGMNYGPDDRESTNVEDRRPAGQAAGRCKDAYQVLRQACISNMDGVEVSNAAVFSGHQEGVARGLASIATSREDLKHRFDGCLAAYSRTKEICDQAYQDAQQVPNSEGEQQIIRDTANESMNVYNTGRRKYDKSWSALTNTEVQLQKIGAATK